MAKMLGVNPPKVVDIGSPYGRDWTGEPFDPSSNPRLRDIVKQSMGPGAMAALIALLANHLAGGGKHATSAAPDQNAYDPLADPNAVAAANAARVPPAAAGQKQPNAWFAPKVNIR